MKAPVAGAAELTFDGAGLVPGPASGRAFQVDARCLEGIPVAGAYAHVCALVDPAASVPFDDPAVQQARRDAYAWWIDRLGAALVCISTLALDGSRYGGAITVTRSPAPWREDPFARIFPGTVLRTGVFCAVPPPAGPVIERYAGVAWPGGTFAG
ncbi:hypothetical protein DSM112329_00588 [Paraconexibacter sp. AEG42_29]|uniref:Uncharacterized protein n=1 Tax=Paraconexibacter sp. AEG42_29 TaxID=2997339 RepID=A0AAU7AQ13_9ACTN